MTGEKRMVELTEAKAEDLMTYEEAKKYVRKRGQHISDGRLHGLIQKGA